MNSPSAPNPASPAPHATPPALGLILARAGSRGVPGKNLAPLAGAPCLTYSFAHARAASSLSLIALSSDSAPAHALAAQHHIVSVTRPAELASDTARIDDAARHAVLDLESRGLLTPHPRTPIIILYANVPIRPADLIDRAVHLLRSTACDSVQSYAPVGKYHPWWTARVDPSTGLVRPWEGDVLNHNVFRRQDLPPAFIPDGGILAVTRAALFLQIPAVPPGPHAFFGADRRGLINPADAVIDIDSPADLARADFLLRSAS